jgi:hypothetical protein
MIEGKLRQSCASDHCFSYVAVESESQFGGWRLLVAGKDRDVMRRYERVWSSFDAGTCRSDQGVGGSR